MVQPTINDRLNEVRLRLGISQKDMAAKLAVRQTFFSDIEKGRRNVSNKFIEKFCQIFPVEKNWLYTGLGNMFTLNEGNNLYPKSVPPSVPSEKNKDILTDLDPTSLVVIDKLIENTIQLIRFYCADFLGRISLSNTDNSDLKAVNKYLKHLEEYTLNIKGKVVFIEDENGKSKLKDSDYLSYTINEKILFLNQLNEKLGRTLDFIWDVTKHGEWTWNK